MVKNILPNQSKYTAYTAKEIQVLEGLDAVRKRPGMYVGSTGSRGLHHLIYEVVDNAIDEAMAGFCTEINVKLMDDGSVLVSDNGRGIPVEKHKQFNVSALQIVLTKLHAGGKFDKKTYKVSGGLHGVGVSVVNALSKKLRAFIYKNKKVFYQEYEKGIPKDELKVIGETSKTGTEIRFWPDDEIFDAVNFDFETISIRLKELAFLNRGLKITLEDEKNKIREECPHFLKNIGIFIEQNDSSPYEGMNHGIDAATGDVIALLHAGDIYCSTGIVSDIVRIFKDSDISFLYGNIIYHAKDDATKTVRIWKSGTIGRNTAKKGVFPPHTSLFIRKETYDLAGRYDTDYEIAADSDFMFRLFALKEIKWHYLDKNILSMRTGGRSNSSVSAILRSNIEFVKILKKHKVKNPLLNTVKKVFSKIKQIP